MPSFTTTACMLIVCAQSTTTTALHAPTPAITSPPILANLEAFVKRDDPDAISLAQILLTAIPESLRAIAATNIPAVSSILWAEFLDDNKPQWFQDLPADVQSYLIRHFGPSTAWPTATPTNPESNLVSTTPASSTQTSDASSGTGIVTSIVTVSIGSIAIPIAVPTDSSAADATPSSSSNPSLSRNQKIGIGLGVPLALLGAIAIFLGCCVLLRRRHKKSVNGSQPPSSPGFIPRFAFQEKGEHHTPLNSNSGDKHLSQDTIYSNYSNWDDDVIETMQASRGPGMNTHNGAHGEPIPAPSLYHTHSSNRARGRRTSYSSLHSVAEMHEPDELPVLPRDKFRPSPPRRQSAGLVPGAAQVKRKPVPGVASATSPRFGTNSHGERNSLAVAVAAASPSHGRLRPSISDQNCSNSSSNSSNSLTPGSGLGNFPYVTASPVSPISDASPPSRFPLASSSPSQPSKNSPPSNPFINDPQSSKSVHSFINDTQSSKSVNPFTNDPQPSESANPFTNDYYFEDYGPEYSHVFLYDDLENGLYGGHTDLSRYPKYSEVPVKGSGRTEWPLRNVMGSMGHKRNKSPLWDRIYEG